MTDVSVHASEGSDTPVSLLVRLQHDEQAAWERLVTLYAPLVIRWCRLDGLQAADAADVGQEVFQAVARRIHDFRRDRPGDTFRGWLRIITRNKVRDYFRAHPAELRAVGGEAAFDQLKLVPSGDSSSDVVDPTERTLLFRQAMDLIRLEFEDHSWQAFWRTAVEGQAPADVARELAISVNAVYLARSRILRRFRDEFQDLVDPEVTD
jgi:RNA polymerase sigma-70 factor (ECF subfamily)